MLHLFLNVEEEFGMNNIGTEKEMPGTDDPFGLGRFLAAQAGNYDRALSEIKDGKKRTHWMWYIFPQIEGLGHSVTSKFYAIKSLEEARAYLRHPILGTRLVECSEAVASVATISVFDIFTEPDDAKLRSCMTLFIASVPDPPPVFHYILGKYFLGEPDDETLRLLNNLEDNGK